MIQTVIDGQHVTVYEMQPNRYQRRVAETAARAAAKELGIPTPRVMFFDPGWRNLKGFTADDNEIWIACGQRDIDVAHVAVHECRHQWQRQHPDEWMARSELSRERDARLFELSWPI